MTTHITEPTIEDIADQWIASRSLPPAMAEALRETHADNLSNLSLIASPAIAPHHISEQLDLPHSSTWLEVTAALLDCIEGSISDDWQAVHLQELQARMTQEGLRLPA